jgi:hypothetical protein
MLLHDQRHSILQGSSASCCCPQFLVGDGFAFWLLAVLSILHVTFQLTKEVIDSILCLLLISILMHVDILRQPDIMAVLGGQLLQSGIFGVLV